MLSHPCETKLLFDYVTFLFFLRMIIAADKYGSFFHYFAKAKFTFSITKKLKFNKA